VASGLEVLESHHGLEALFLELQELVMKIRMVPVGPTFQPLCAKRTRRCPEEREACAHVGSGRRRGSGHHPSSSTFHDPLMHMIRNSVDHGLEAPRSAPARWVRIPAERSCCKLFTIPGHRGADLRRRSRFGSRANSQAREGERNSFQREPASVKPKFIASSFSQDFRRRTKCLNYPAAAWVWDVVRRNVNALSGAIQLESRKGQGTTFTIRLPLTLGDY